MAGYKVVIRPDTRTLTITGEDPRGGRFRRAAKSVSRKQALAEAAHLYDQHLKESWHGQQRGSHPFEKAVLSYIKAKPRRPQEVARLERLVAAVGEKTQLNAIDQDTVTRMSEGRSPAWVQREAITPLRSVLRHAARRKWCDVPLFDAQPRVEGRTLFLLPDQAERLVGEAAPHLRPLLCFLLATGARLAEALELEGRDVDLEGARVIFWRTKNGKRRNAFLPPRAVVALRMAGVSEGRVFRRPDGEPYADRDRSGGGQIRKGFAGAVQRAGLEPELTPHCLRHTWATWHYALHRDFLKLKVDGGWSSVMMVERYAHLMPADHEAAIRQFLGIEGRTLRIVA